MEGLLNYFWLFCGAWVGIGNAVILRSRLNAAIRDAAISRAEANRFAVGAIGWIGGPCLAFWIMQDFFVGAISPDFRTWGSPCSEIASMIVGLLWVVSFTWIWLGGGDRQLARIFTLAKYQTFIWSHPLAFRIAIIAAIAGGVVGLLASEPVLPGR